MGLFLLWREIEDRMADRAKKMEATLRPGRVQRLLGHLADLRKILLREPKNAFGIVGARNLLGHPRLVVAGVCPAEHILEHRILEEFPGEIDGARGLV